MVAEERADSLEAKPSPLEGAFLHVLVPPVMDCPFYPCVFLCSLPDICKSMS